MLYISYPKCTTCRDAKKWLTEKGHTFSEKHIKDDNPTAAELQAWHEKSDLPIKKFFNTSGNSYKALGLKDKIDAMSLSECYELLATDGMLVKRPIVVTDHKVVVGFKVDIWEKELS